MTLNFQGCAGIGPCMDLRIHNGYLYAIQNNSQYPNGRLCVLKPDLSLIATFIGIGDARQIEISENIIIVTARADGLWIFDISGITPVLLSHYQTLEFATGATLYANYALVSCRQYGVEIIDLNVPTAPKHIGTIRIGEVQSACVYNGYLYGGVWGEMNIAVVDIRNITNPQLVTRIPLEGRGDGVMAWENRLYAVTGQHRRGILNISDPLDPAYGNGNGLTIFDISDSKNPVKLHREEFGTCYNAYFDMWKPVLCGNMILCGCSSLGVFAYERESLRSCFRLMIPMEDKYTHVITRSIAQVGPFDTASPVTGFATLENTLYLCSGCADLCAYNSKEYFGEMLRWDTKSNFCVEKDVLNVCCDGPITIQQRYCNEYAPVLAVCECDNTLAVACSSVGVFLLDSDTYEEVFHLPAEGFCCDVKYACGWLAVAIGDNGISLYHKDGISLSLVSNIKTPKTAQQLYITSDARYLVATSGASHCLLYDISDKKNPQLIAERFATQGPLYGQNFATGTLEDGTILLFWHRDGLVYTNPGKEDFAFHNIFYYKTNGFMGFGPETGCDTDGQHIFYNLNGGYCILPLTENVDVDSLDVYRADVPIQGKFTLCGPLLVAAERAKGIITVMDISNIKTPRHIGSCTTNASPGKPVYIKNRILIPGGHQGLLELTISLGNY